MNAQPPPKTIPSIEEHYILALAIIRAMIDKTQRLIEEKDLYKKDMLVGELLEMLSHLEVTLESLRLQIALRIYEEGVRNG